MSYRKTHEILSGVNELNYFTELGKPIYCISKEAIDEGNICLDKMSDPWFLDADYKAMALIEGKNIKA